MPLEKRLCLHVTKSLFLLAVCLSSSTLGAQSPRLSTGEPRVFLGNSLAISVPISNIGQTLASAVTLTSIKLRPSSQLRTPNSLPFVIGDILPGQTLVATTTFDSTTLLVGHTYLLTLQGTYLTGSVPSGFVLNVPILIPPRGSSLFVGNATDPLLIRAVAGDGKTTVDYFGDKTADGVAANLTGIRAQTQAGETRISSAPDSNVVQIIGPDGSVYKIAPQTSTLTNVTIISANRAAEVTIPVATVPGTARVATSPHVSSQRDRTIGLKSLSITPGPKPLSTSANSYTVKVAVTQCSTPVTEARVWANVSGISGRLPAIHAAGDGDGVYTVSIPTPDPEAASGLQNKCEAVFEKLKIVGDVVDIACMPAKVAPVEQLSIPVCAGSLVLGPEAPVLCELTFQGYKYVCDTNELLFGALPPSQPFRDDGPSLADVACPTAGAIDRGINLLSPFTISFTVNDVYTSPAQTLTPISLPTTIPFSVPCTPVQVSIKKSGNGSGVVTGPGINCGQACSTTVLPTDSVTLTANEDSGSKFMGWNGACAGSDHTVKVNLRDETGVCIADFEAYPTGILMVDCYRRR